MRKSNSSYRISSSRAFSLSIVAIALAWPLGASAATKVIPAVADGAAGDDNYGLNFAITFQNLFAASQLNGLPAGATITGLQFRHDSSVSTSPLLSATNFDVYLGPPTGATLGMSVTGNEGPETVQVRSGAITFPAGAFPSGGNPNAFGPVIGFDTPFTYTGGPLLVTLSYTDFTDGMGLDFVSSGLTGNDARESLGYNASTLDDSAPESALVMQLVYTVPEPTSAGIMIVGGIGFLSRRRGRTRQSLPGRARHRYGGTSTMIASVLILAAIGATSAEAAPVITSIGVLSGETYSSGSAISGDGSTVTGYSGHYNSQQQLLYDRAIRWTSAGGLQDIGSLPVGNTRALGFAVNVNGTAIAGASLSNNGSVNARAFRWTQNGGIQALGLLPGGSYSDARAISADASVVVGYAGDSSGNNRAFRWTASGGMQNLGVLPGMNGSNGYGVSHDGSIVVGSSYTDLTSRAFRWTSSGGMTSLGLLPGGDSSGALAVSGDGSVIIGESYSSTTGQSSFRWTSAGGMQDLGTVPGPDYGEFDAGSVNGNGSEVLGNVYVLHSTDFSHPALWTSSLGVVDLTTYLPSVGVDLTGWKLSLAYGISDDGTAITGDGTFEGQPRGWIVTGLPVPEPGTVGLLTVFAAGFVARRRRHNCGAARIAKIFPLNTSHLLLAFLFLFIAGNTFAQPFTYTYFPSNAVINAPVTTDLAIVGYAGGIYNDDFTRNFTGPSSPTVTIAAGADVADAEVFNSSVVNVTGGSVAAFMYDTAKLNISGGNVPLALSFYSAEMNVTGGTVDDIEGQGRRINVSGGTINTLVANSQTDPFGENLGSCVVDVTGGIFTSEITGYNDGIVNLRGGSILGAKLKAADGATFNIYGSGLTAQLLDPNAPNGYSLYTVSGLLSDGSPLDGVELRVRNDGATYGHSSFNLIDVPEPGAVGALGLGGLCAACRRRRNRTGVISGL